MFRFLPLLFCLSLTAQITEIVRWRIRGVGLTSQRPTSCVSNKDVWINTTLNTLQYCISGSWTSLGSGTSGTVTSVATTSPITGGTITGSGTIACATCVTSAASLTSNLPVFGAGSQATAVGTRSGNTTKVVTMDASTPATDDCAKWDANGNLTTAGAACGTGGSVTSVDATGGVETASGSAITTTGTIRGGIVVNAQTGTSYTILTGDRGKLVTHTNGSAIAVTLPQAGGTFPANWYYMTQNRGAGTVTITPTTSTIDGAASLALLTGQGAIIVSDGTNYFTMRGLGTATGLGDPGSNSIVYRNGAGTSAPATATEMAGPNNCADAGASDTYACNLSPAPSAYTTRACYVFTANTANTGAATINFNSLGAKTIKKAAGGVTTDLADNDIRASQVVTVCYDGTNMQMQSTLGNAASGGGDSTNTGAYSSASASNDGNLYFPNNGVTVMRDTGSVFADWGPIYPFTKPVNGDFSDLGSPTVTTTYGGIIVEGSGTPFNIVGRIKSAPATPYTITAAFLVQARSTSNSTVGLLFRESGSGKLSIFNAFQHTPQNQTVVFRMTNTTTYAGTTDLNDATYYFGGELVWLRISDDGTTNRVYSRSTNGLIWTTMLTQARTTHLTADQVGFYVDGAGAQMHLLHWKQE